MSIPHKVLEFPLHLCLSIEKYLDTNWNNDPSKFGALNAVAYIGERVTALYASKRELDGIDRQMREDRAVLEHFALALAKSPHSPLSFHEARDAVRALLLGPLNSGEREVLVTFASSMSDRYPTTCAALTRALAAPPDTLFTKLTITKCGTLDVNGSNLGPAERDPRTGNIEAGPVVRARTAPYTKKSRAATHAKKARQSSVKKARR